jgi:hypothetical protein
LILKRFIVQSIYLKIYPSGSFNDPEAMNCFFREREEVEVDKPENKTLIPIATTKIETDPAHHIFRPNLEREGQTV